MGQILPECFHVSPPFPLPFQANFLRSNASLTKPPSKPVDKQLTPPPSPPVRRRGPGRPSKAQSAAQFPNNKRPTGHSAVRFRRQMHNDSAMRSRARLNNTLEKLWNIIPKHERVVQPGMGDGDLDDGREVCRAVKVEVAIAYLIKLQTIVRTSSHDITLF
jgi:hypothetical protein